MNSLFENLETNRMSQTMQRNAKADSPKPEENLGHPVTGKSAPGTVPQEQKEGEDLYIQNYKTLIKKTKEDK